MEGVLSHTSTVATSTLVVFGAVATFFLTAVSAYAVRSLLVGRRQDEKLQRLGGTLLLGSWFMEAVYWAIRAPGKLFARLGVKPDTLTLISLVLTLPSTALDDQPKHKEPEQRPENGLASGRLRALPNRRLTFNLDSLAHRPSSLVLF